MAGIAGIADPNQWTAVERMLDKIAYRGRFGRELVQTGAVTAGIVKAMHPATNQEETQALCSICDTAGPERLAGVRLVQGEFALVRDPFGVAPLYYGRNADGAVCFASEVKALLEVTGDVNELPPGSLYDGESIRPYRRTETRPVLSDEPEEIAAELRLRLETAIAERAAIGDVGAWLSGGLDSSTMAALARPYVYRLHTVAAGVSGAPDLEYAAVVAAFIDADHHEVVVGTDDLLAALPQVIYHLESFDALLVRSSITNYLAAQAASDYVSAVFSGEGGDELFAGYAYLKTLDPALLAGELLDITGRLHNTALQRVDRCAAAFGTVAFVPFLDSEVAGYAQRIPVGLKLHDGVEKWILRRAMEGALPEPVLRRTKSKFWEGAGVGDLLSDYAEGAFTDAAFLAERVLPNGWVLNSKEELMYYRMFREHFGERTDLSWMGRTKMS